jgi:hypothetical protein
MRTDGETKNHDEAKSRISQFCEHALTRVFTLEHYTYQFLRQETKLHLPYFATDQLIFSSVDGGETGVGTNYRGPASRRPDSIAHAFVFSVASDAVR